MKRTISRKVLLALYFFLLVTPVWVVKYPAILDYPDHVTRVKIARDLDNPSFDYSKYYRYTWSGFRTYYFFDGITYLLSFPFGVFTAGKLTLSLYVALMLAASLALLRACGQPFWPLGLWPAIFIYNWWYSGGSIDLVAGYGFAVAGLAAFMSGLPSRTKAIFVIMALGAAAASHPLSFLLGAAVLLWLGLSGISDRILRIRLTIVYAAMVFAASVLSHSVFPQPFDLQDKLGRLLWLLHDYNPRLENPLLLLSLFFVGLMWIYSFPRLCGWRRSLPMVLFFLAILTPSWVHHIGFNEMRIALFGLLILPLSVKVPDHKWIRIGLSVMFLACAVVWNAGQIQKQFAYAPFFKELDEVINQIPMRSKIRPIVEFTGAPNQKAFHYCTFYKGGFVPSMLTSPYCGLTYAPGFGTPPQTLSWPDSAELVRFDALLTYKSAMRGEKYSPGFDSVYSGQTLALRLRFQNSNQPTASR